MAEILSPSGLEKPAGGEPHSRAQYLRNLDRINDQLVQIDYASSTLDSGSWDFKICKFTRIRVGNEGIVIADILISLPAAALPANTATPLEFLNMIPVGYSPVNGASLPLQVANTANSGQGSNLHVGLKYTGRAFLIRSAQAGFTTVAGSTLTWSTAYRWDGVL